MLWCLWLADIDIQHMTRDHDQFLRILVSVFLIFQEPSPLCKAPCLGDHYGRVPSVSSVALSHPTLVFTPFSLLTLWPSHVETWSECLRWELNRQILNQGLVSAVLANPTLLGENVGSNAKSLSMLINIDLSQIKVPVFCCWHIGCFCRIWIWASYL